MVFRARLAESWNRISIMGDGRPFNWEGKEESERKGMRRGSWKGWGNGVMLGVAAEVHGTIV